MKRNSFARGEYERVTISDHFQHCTWCGQHKRRLYAYAWSPDDRPVNKNSIDTVQRFCDFSCFEAFNI